MNEELSLGVFIYQPDSEIDLSATNVFHFPYDGKCYTITVDVKYSREHKREHEPLVSITGCRRHRVATPESAAEASSVYDAFVKAHRDDIAALFV